MAHKVHCIEDNQIMQKIYRRMMDAVDFAEEIIPAYNGLEGINYYKKLLNGTSEEQTVPNVIFLDLNMPVMDGWRFLDEFSKLPLPDFINPEIVIVTSSVNPEDQEKARKYQSVRTFLTKPLTIEILEELDRQLNNRS